MEENLLVLNVHANRLEEKKALVRSFSDDWKAEEPENALSQSLAAKVERDRKVDNDAARLRNEWKLLFTDAARIAEGVPEEDQVLAEQSCALAAAWETFVSKLPKEQRENVRSLPPSLSSVHNAVKSATRLWQDKRDSTRMGRLKHMFAKVVKSCDDHSDLLSVIPQDDKYVSLIAGSLRAIVKASINHEKIAEGVSNSMNELCEEIAYWRRLMQKHGNNWFMQRYIRDLYVVVFEFFTELFVQWSASGLKRLVNSFDKNAFDNLFVVHQRKMKVIADKLEREARLERETRIDDMFSTIAARHESSFDSVSSQMMAIFRALGNSGQNFLEETDLEIAARSKNIVLPLGSPPDASNMPEEQTSPENQTVQYFQRDLITSHPEIRSLILEHDEDVKYLIPRAVRIQVDMRVARRVRQLLHEADAACLWVEGPTGHPIPTQNTLTAVYIAAAAESSKLQVISHFCALDLRQTWTPQDHLCLLLRSIIAQAIRFIPERFFSNRNVSQARLGACFAPSASSSKLLATLEDVLSLISDEVVCVIDGLQALEQRSDRMHTKHMFQVFQTLCGSGRGKSPLKVLMTTDGYADRLARLVNAGAVDKIVSDHDSNDVCEVSMVTLGAESE